VRFEVGIVHQTSCADAGTVDHDVEGRIDLLRFLEPDAGREFPACGKQTPSQIIEINRRIAERNRHEELAPGRGSCIETFGPGRNCQFATSAKLPEFDHRYARGWIRGELTENFVTCQRPGNHSVRRFGIVGEPHRGRDGRGGFAGRFGGENVRLVILFSEQDSTGQPGNSGSDDRDAAVHSA
jgi:hypothetical protein